MDHLVFGIFFGILTIVSFIRGFTTKDKVTSMLCFVCGLFALLLTVESFITKETNHMDQLISECEQTLPRN